MTQVIALASVKGAGGVTASSLGIAAACGRRGGTVLVEADPSGGSMLGWSRLLNPLTGGLYEAVFARDRPGLSSLAQPLGDIAVLTSPGDAHRITAAIERHRDWRSLFAGFAELVVVDLGRLFPGSPSSAIAAIADRVIMVTPPESEPLLATLEWSGRSGQLTAGAAHIDRKRIAVLTVDVGTERSRRLDPDRIQSEMDVEHLGHLAEDSRTLDLLCRGSSLAHRSMRRSRLAPALSAVAERVTVASRSEARR